MRHVIETDRQQHRTMAATEEWSQAQLINELKARLRQVEMWRETENAVRPMPSFPASTTQPTSSHSGLPAAAATGGPGDGTSVAGTAGVMPPLPTVATPTIRDVRDELFSAVGEALRTFKQAQHDFNEEMRDEQNKMSSG